MEGWIKLHRKIKNNPLFLEDRRFSKFEAWVDLLLEVNHSDKQIWLGMEVIEIKRGEKVTSLVKLANRWNWSTTKVNSFLKALESEGMIVIKKDKKKTAIYLVKYEFYQSLGDVEKTQKNHEKNTEKMQKNTNKNVKNVKNEKKKERRKPVYDDTSLFYQLAVYFLEQIRKNKPDYQTPNLHNWADDIRKMVERDHRTEAQIRQVMCWVQQDDFEKVNVLSPRKLRSRFDQIMMKLEKKQHPVATPKKPRKTRDMIEHLKLMSGEAEA